MAFSTERRDPYYNDQVKGNHMIVLKAAQEEVLSALQAVSGIVEA